MASKQFPLAGYGEITIIKRAGSRNIRLSIRADGKAVVSIPAWTSYYSGLSFAQSKLDWLLEQQPQRAPLQDGQPVGKQHHLQLSPTRGSTSVKTLVTKTAVIVRFPIDMQPTNEEVQTAAETACIRALRSEATAILPGRLEQLAQQHGFHFNEVRIKRLKGRWGSCDQQQRIVLNLFLMQLPWECIDYVLLHELTHTKVMQHGPPFWAVMERLIPNLAEVRKIMRTQRPVLH